MTPLSDLAKLKVTWAFTIRWCLSSSVIHWH